MGRHVFSIGAPAGAMSKRLPNEITRARDAEREREVGREREGEGLAGPRERERVRSEKERRKTMECGRERERRRARETGSKETSCGARNYITQRGGGHIQQSTAVVFFAMLYFCVVAVIDD